MRATTIRLGTEEVAWLQATWPSRPVAASVRRILDDRMRGEGAVSRVDEQLAAEVAALRAEVARLERRVVELEVG
jgi:hypothetical protein